MVTSGRVSGVKFCQNKFVMDPHTNISSHNARAYPVSDACQYPPTAWRNRQGVPREPRPRLKKLVEKEMRVGTWNVGTMTGKGRELVEVSKRRSLDILCVQETKWGGNSSRQLGDKYRIIYSGETNNRNGVGIILSPHLSEQVVQVDRHSDRLIKVKLISGGGGGDDKHHLGICPSGWRERSQQGRVHQRPRVYVNNIPEGEKVIIGADLNAHLGEGGEGYRRIHGGEGYGKRNAEGQKALESLEGLDMAVVNTFFKKREKQKITYKSG